MVEEEDQRYQGEYITRVMCYRYQGDTDKRYVEANPIAYRENSWAKEKAQEETNY